jgi:sarcosine oxidase subunit alpha
MLRIGFVGETGWEIHFPSEYGEHLWDVLMKAGAGLGIRPFGIEAQRLLRLEKRHPIVGVDTDSTSNPLEADMAWVAKLDKDDFIGKAAILRVKERGMREKLVGFVIQDTTVPEDGAAIVINGKPAGRVTSVRFSPASGRAVGMAWVPAEVANGGQEIQVHINGRLAKAIVVQEAFYDAKGERLRM